MKKPIIGMPKYYKEIGGNTFFDQETFDFDTNQYINFIESELEALKKENEAIESELRQCKGQKDKYVNAWSQGEKEITELRRKMYLIYSENEELKELIYVDDDECNFDHHGFC